MSELAWFLFENVAFPFALGAVASAFAPFAFVLGIPVLGPWLRGKILAVLKKLFDMGVITVKWEVLDKLDAKAKAGYEPWIAKLKEAQTKEFMSEEEELEYERALKEMVRNHSGVVHG